CGVGDIRGQELAPIRGRMRGCAVERPVRVTSIAGVRLSQPAVIDCTTARALRGWIGRGVKPAVGRLGGGVSGLRVAASYSCRTRNSKPGAKLSEHAKGHAIDISGIELANGKTITVLDGWGRRAEGKILRRVHKAACGPFGTVLGPGSDRYHKDHLHLDTARYRGGPYCR
ncbi:MAG: extensin family protein, partial [Alphaproteobacteria bacterium]